MTTWARALVMVAGMMGTAGVILAAAGAHEGGGDLVRLAAEFLLIHAAVVLSLGLSALMGSKPHRIWLIAASLLAVGVTIFAADLAEIAFTGVRAIRFAAPLGGTLMILGWLVLTVGTAFVAVSPGPNA